MNTLSTTTHTTKSARVIIADDHDLARAGLYSMLSSEQGLKLVGMAANGSEALTLCRELGPDLALLDVRMPDMDGLAATRAIKQAHPEIGVIIVTMHENPDYLLEAIKAGAAGYVLKDATHREFITAIRQVLRGASCLNGELMTQVLRRVVDEPARPPVERLTPREMEVLRLLAQGHTNRQIASTLIISSGTAKIHVERIIAKLGVSDRTQAAVRAVEMRLI